MYKIYFPLLMLVATLLFAGTPSALAQKDDTAPLKFNPSGAFKVAQFTDIHWNPSSKNNQKTIELINLVIKEEKPDLLVFSGDIVTKSPARQGWLDVTRPAVESGIPWVITLGNHDDETDMNRNEIYDLLLTLRGFRGEKGPDISGTGNYFLPVVASTGNKMAATLWFFDSGGYPSDKKYGKYAWIKFDQIGWYREKSAGMTASNDGKPLASFAYFHIPLPEYKLVTGLETTIGRFEEDVCSPDVNSGLFNAFLEMGDVMGMSVGHDHVNNFIGTHMGIAMAYGQVSGADAYGDFPRGSRIVELREGSRTFNSWIRTADSLLYPYSFKP